MVVALPRQTFKSNESLGRSKQDILGLSRVPFRAKNLHKPFLLMFNDPDVVEDVAYHRETVYQTRSSWNLNNRELQSTALYTFASRSCLLRFFWYIDFTFDLASACLLASETLLTSFHTQVGFTAPASSLPSSTCICTAMASQIPSIETLRWICWEPCYGQSNHVSTW